MGRNNLLGAWGEALAADYLRKKHYSILESNFRTRMGEIDLIAADRRYLVFVEVKLRKNADFAMARVFVDSGKQRRIRTPVTIWPAIPPACSPGLMLLKYTRRRAWKPAAPPSIIWRMLFNEHTRI